MAGGRASGDFKLLCLICRGAIKLYSDFYEADIIVASPIALVTKPGDEGAQQDLDYLSSIEIVVAPRCDVLQMQNWAHVQSGSLQRLVYTWAQLLWVCAPRLPPANSRLSNRSQDALLARIIDSVWRGSYTANV